MRSTLVIDSCGYPNGTPTVSFGDGDAPNFESANAKPIGSYATTGNTKVTGFVDKGTFNKAIDSELLAKDFVCVYKEAGKYGVDKADDYVAKVGDIYYATLQDAIDEANSGDTVELVKGVVTDKVIVVDEKITLDMNRKTLSNTKDLWANDGNWSLISVREGGDLTITGNGTLQTKKDDCFAVDVQDGANLTIENGTFVGNIHAVYVFEGTATINGGAYSVQQKFSAEKPDEFVLNCYDANRANGTAVIIVNGGTFQNFDPMNNQAEGAGTSFVALGVGVNADENGSFTAVADMTAQLVDENGKSVKAYKKLSYALADAKDGQTVKLLNDVANETFVMVKAGVTLDLAGKNITDTTYIYVTGMVKDTADVKGYVKAELYAVFGNAFTPVYDSEKDGYSFFDLDMDSMWVSAESKAYFALKKSGDYEAAAKLMEANSSNRRVKAVITFSWDDKTSVGHQSYEFIDEHMAVALAAALLLSLCAACGKKAEEQTDGDGKPGSTQQDAAKDGSTNAGNKTADSVLDVSGGVVENPFAEDTSDKSQTEDAKQGEPSHSGGNSGNTSAPDASQNLKWEEFYALSATQKDAYVESFDDYEKFFDWMVKAQEQFKTEHPTIEIGPDGSIDLSKLG